MAKKGVDFGPMIRGIKKLSKALKKIKKKRSK